MCMCYVKNTSYKLTINLLFEKYRTKSFRQMKKKKSLRLDHKSILEFRRMSFFVAKIEPKKLVFFYKAKLYHTLFILLAVLSLALFRRLPPGVLEVDFLPFFSFSSSCMLCLRFNSAKMLTSKWYRCINAI